MDKGIFFNFLGDDNNVQLYVNFATLFLNIVALALSIYFNGKGYLKRRKQDREFNIEFELFSNIVIRNYSKVVQLSKDFDNAYSDLCKSMPSQIIPFAIKSRQEKYCDLIRDLISRFETDVLQLFHCYDYEIKKELQAVSDDFYDSTTEIFVSIDSTIHSPLVRKLKDLMFNQSKKKYLIESTRILRQFKPR